MSWNQSPQDRAPVAIPTSAAESLRDRIKAQLGWSASAPTDGQIFEL